MSLILTSSNKALDAYLRRIDSDDSTSPVELQAIRDQADEHVNAVTGVTANADSLTPLGKAIVQLLAEADAMVEGMQRVAIEARRAKLLPDRREELKEAIEHQIGYVVAGYQSSIQRL
ncbi:MAG TPA: hypothetical protein VM621_08255 [Luteibacter sp.]|uniref:hypothetical protein n=1 Tax=Luteibacter sp. TaxID=1886636 RepID=UPI002B9059AB|nr:hypothetical protein [Luteibacter sp.]HVI55029.1 hypothetical protein [Luteibacter sp.]